MTNPTDYIKRRVEKMKKTKLNGEGLPFENSPDIFGNERVEAYRKGYNTALDAVLPLIEELLQEERGGVAAKIHEVPWGETVAQDREAILNTLQKDIPTTKEPTLEEMIEACGEEFACVRNFKEELIRAHGKIQGLEYWNSGSYGTEEWVADSTRSWTSKEGTSGWVSAKGSTPKEAVKNLLAALSDKK